MRICTAAAAAAAGLVYLYSRLSEERSLAELELLRAELIRAEESQRLELDALKQQLKAVVLSAEKTKAQLEAVKASEEAIRAALEEKELEINSLRVSSSIPETHTTTPRYDRNLYPVANSFYSPSVDGDLRSVRSEFSPEGLNIKGRGRGLQRTEKNWGAAMLRSSLFSSAGSDSQSTRRQLAL